MNITNYRNLTIHLKRGEVKLVQLIISLVQKKNREDPNETILMDMVSSYVTLRNETKEIRHFQIRN